MYACVDILYVVYAIDIRNMFYEWPRVVILLIYHSVAQCQWTNVKTHGLNNHTNLIA